MSDQRSNGFIRMALMGTAFVALTVVLIVFQPGSPRHAVQNVDETSNVTRVAPAFDQIETQAAQPMQELIAAPNPIGPPTDGVQADPAPITTMPNSMRDMTFAAITNLKSATTGATPAPGEPGSLLHGVVQRSLNANGVATTTAPDKPLVTVSEPQRQTEARSYFVRPGDTLVTIAQDIYGDVNMASQLFLSNRTLMSRPDDLRPGMVLELP